MIAEEKKKLRRETFRTSRAMEFLSRKELIAQTGHQPEVWPLMVLKELVDNALDACEEAGIAPKIQVTVDEEGILIADNGPGIPPQVVRQVLDFSTRVSSREAYVAPDRGAQGNALKTILAVPFVLNGECGIVEISARGVRHKITLKVDPIRQEPVIDHRELPDDQETEGTTIRIVWSE
ncbi:MAG: ATP-binding protein [Planctomycetota bacterium]